jgi:hypothetical protein
VCQELVELTPVAAAFAALFTPSITICCRRSTTAANTINTIDVNRNVDATTIVHPRFVRGKVFLVSREGYSESVLPEPLFSGTAV